MREPYAQPFEDDFDDGLDIDPAVVGDESDTIRPFRDMDYFDGDEGSANADESVESPMPPAGWNQSPDEFHGDNRPTIRWGDIKALNVPPDPLGGTVLDPVLQVLDFYLQMPAVCLIRLSAQDLTPGIVIAATDLVTWTLLIGVGSSTQTRKYQRQFSPADGSADRDLYLTMPVEHLVATATVQSKADTVVQRTLEISAQVAPFTVAPWMAR